MVPQIWHQGGRTLVVEAGRTIRAPSWDDEVVYTHAGSIHQNALAEQIQRAGSRLGPEVARVAYRTGEDSTGAPSIFFRITLHDWATAENVIADITGRVAGVLFDEIRPLDNWDLRPYFNFRSVSEQLRRPDPDWI